MIPKITYLSVFLASFLFLFCGFICNAIYWNQVLKESHYNVGFSSSLAGFGLSIFGKYIPGKIWVAVGRAAYIAEKHSYSLGKLSALSFYAQLIAIWTGLIFGAIGLFISGGFHLFGWIILFLWLSLTFVIFSKLAHRTLERFIRIVLRKDLQLPKLTIKSIFLVFLWSAVYWVLLSIGFYMLVTSLIAVGVPWSVGLGFPLAVNLGIIVLFTPGGLGTREAVIVAYLSLMSIPIIEATNIAVVSRLWFLFGELFIFIIGWGAEKTLIKLK